MHNDLTISSQENTNGFLVTWNRSEKLYRTSASLNSLYDGEGEKKTKPKTIHGLSPFNPCLLLIKVCPKEHYSVILVDVTLPL